jgi:hypothetical protein
LNPQDDESFELFSRRRQGRGYQQRHQWNQAVTGLSCDWQMDGLQLKSSPLDGEYN